METAAKRQNTRNDDDKEDKYKDNEEEEGDNNDKEMEEDKANNKKQNKLSRVPDELGRFQKKGKSSKFNPRNYEQVKSSPSLKVWSHEGSILTPKMAHYG